MRSFPSISGPRQPLAGIAGSPPDLGHPPSGCRFHPRCPQVFERCSKEEPDFYKRAGPRALLSFRPMTVADLPLRPREDARELLRTADLTKHFRLGGILSSRYLHGVDGINLPIHDDEIVGLVGESGRGKSTLARLLAGVYP